MARTWASFRRRGDSRSRRSFPRPGGSAFALRSGRDHRPPPGLAASLRDLTVTEGDRIEIEDETGRLYRAEVDSVRTRRRRQRRYREPKSAQTEEARRRPAIAFTRHPPG